MRSLKFLSAALLILCMGMILGGCSETSVNDLVQQGDDAYSKGSYATADVAYTSVVEQGKATDEIYNNRGMCRLMTEDFTAAIADFQEAIRLNGECAVYYNNCGLAYYKNGDYQNGLDMFSRAIELDDTVAAYFVNRGDCYYELVNPQACTVDYKKALEMDPSLSHAYNNLASAYFNIGDYENAIIYYNTAIELEPEKNVLYWNRGESYRMLGKYEEALADFTLYEELSPYVSIDFHLKKAEIETELGDLAAARNDYTASLAQMPTDADLYLGRANVSYAMEEWNDALSDYGKYLYYKEEAIAYGNRGYCYYMLEQYEAALNDLNKCIDLNPSYAWAYYARGQVKAMMEDFEGAKADYDMANELLGPEDDPFWTETEEPQEETSEVEETE